MERIFALKNAEKQKNYLETETTFSQTEKDGERKSYTIPSRQGDFDLYYLLDEEHIMDFWYVSNYRKELNIQELLADIRVLIEKCSKGQPFECKIIICTNDDFVERRESIFEKFNKLLEFVKKTERKKFELLIWDKNGLEDKEKELGLIV
jgi:hypothetical protein